MSFEDRMGQSQEIVQWQPTYHQMGYNNYYGDYSGEWNAAANVAAPSMPFAENGYPDGGTTSDIVYQALQMANAINCDECGFAFTESTMPEVFSRCGHMACGWCFSLQSRRSEEFCGNCLGIYYGIAGANSKEDVRQSKREAVLVTPSPPTQQENYAEGIPTTVKFEVADSNVGSFYVDGDDFPITPATTRIWDPTSATSSAADDEHRRFSENFHSIMRDIMAVGQDPPPHDVAQTQEFPEAPEPGSSSHSAQSFLESTESKIEIIDLASTDESSSDEANPPEQATLDIVEQFTMPDDQPMKIKGSNITPEVSRKNDQIIYSFGQPIEFVVEREELVAPGSPEKHVVKYNIIADSLTIQEKSDNGRLPLKPVKQVKTKPVPKSKRSKSPPEVPNTYPRMIITARGQQQVKQPPKKRQRTTSGAEEERKNITQKSDVIPIPMPSTSQQQQFIPFKDNSGRPSVLIVPNSNNLSYLTPEMWKMAVEQQQIKNRNMNTSSQ